ncbi:efflux transporter outer membrane subunit [bacterium]|nr:efflux transporter outer membrane subunit [bacterium]
MKIQMNMVSIRLSTILIYGIGLIMQAGCVTVGPDYVPQEISLAESWQTELSGGLSIIRPTVEEMKNWWERLSDPVLNELIGIALERNLDIRDAQSRLRQSRAQRAIARSDLFPLSDGSGSASRSGNHDDTGSLQENNSFSLGFDASWEIDIFGGTRRAIEAADAGVLSAREHLLNTQISIIAEVARTYIEVRTLQSRLNTSLKNLALLRETSDLTAIRVMAGLDDDLARQQAMYNFESTKAQIPSLRISLREAQNSLTVLLGKKPGELGALIESTGTIPFLPETVTIGIPADTIRQRPDVRKAEYELIAQTARVGVATSDLYPRLSLNGSLGLAASESGSLFKSESGSYNYGLHFSWPIFHAGAIRQNIEVQSALQEQALIDYEATILAAFEEVENVLMAYGQEQQRYRALEKAVRAARIAADLAQNQYNSGLVDFSNLLDTQRSLNSYEDQLVQSQGELIYNFIRLFKALGGSWQISVNKTGPSTGDISTAAFDHHEILEGEKP